jgi:hypothetical protein
LLLPIKVPHTFCSFILLVPTLLKVNCPKTCHQSSKVHPQSNRVFIRKNS